MRDRITTGSIATLGSVSLLGESAVDITPSHAGHADSRMGLRAGRRARRRRFADVAEQASEGVGEITPRAATSAPGRGTVGKLMTDDQLYVELTAFVATAGDDDAGHSARAAARSASW